MAPLVAAFEKEYPELKGKIYYETLPPGILIRQVRQGNTITVGNMTWKIQPNVYAAGLTHIHHRQTPLFLMQGLADAGVTWKSEAIFQEQAGHPISNIPICSESSSVADGCVSHLRQTLSLCFERACRDSFANSSRIRFANSCSAAARY